MFRAALTVVVLTALLILAILVVSSLSAPSAKAPTTPPTPGPITPVTSPVAPTAAKTATVTGARPTPSPTHRKTLGSIVGTDRRTGLAERRASRALLVRAASAQVAVRAHGMVATFAAAGGPATARRLAVQRLPHGRSVALGPADSLVRPVWSSDARYLLYVRVTPSARAPGASWQLMEYDAWRHTNSRLVEMGGLALTPLGWSGRAPLFMVASTTDTSIYALRGGLPRFVTVLASQVITSAVLSPSRPIVAFAAPTNCYNCTLDFLDLRTRTAWSGPSGFLDESELAWSGDGRSVVTMLHGRLAVATATPGAATRLGPAVDLPLKWQHSLEVRAGRSSVHVRDTIDGSTVSGTYSATAAAF